MDIETLYEVTKNTLETGVCESCSNGVLHVCPLELKVMVQAVLDHEKLFYFEEDESCPEEQKCLWLVGPKGRVRKNFCTFHFEAVMEDDNG